jgi:hypothetical protein
VREMAKRSPWIKEIVEHLEDLVELRNTMLFSKEATYAAASLSTRQRPKSELRADFDNLDMPLYQRINTRQGTRRQEDSDDKPRPADLGKGQGE